MKVTYRIKHQVTCSVGIDVTKATQTETRNLYCQNKQYGGTICFHENQIPTAKAIGHHGLVTQVLVKSAFLMARWHMRPALAD